MTRALFLTLCIATLLSQSTTSKADDGSNIRQYAVAMAIIENQNGLEKTIAAPTLIVKDGEEGSFLSGSQLPVDAEKKQFVDVGTRARLTITQKADKLRIALQVGRDDVSEQTDGGFVVRQSGIQCVKTIHPGETFVVDMGDGRSVKVTVLAIGAQQLASVKD